VSTNTKFTFSEEGLLGLLENMHLIVVVVCFEAFLRILLLVTQDTDGRSRFPLLSPAYFCMITPLFYLGLWLFGVSTEQATESGYFFPATIPSCNIELMDCVRPDSVWSLVADEHLWDMFKIINFNNISWQAVIHSVGTIAALVSFSALHIPINIPAFAISTDVGTYHCVTFHQWILVV
jgi:SulP family sulfate permease